MVKEVYPKLQPVSRVRLIKLKATGRSCSQCRGSFRIDGSRFRMVAKLVVRLSVIGQVRCRAPAWPMSMGGTWRGQ
jgi:hypothetical protein